MTLAAPIDRRVDADLDAYQHGPAALDNRLNQLPAAEVLARYRALIERTNLTNQPRVGARRAWADFDRHQAHEDAIQIRRGGNR